MQSRNQLLLFLLFWVVAGAIVIAVVPGDIFSSQSSVTTIGTVGVESPAVRSVADQSVPVVRISEPTNVVGELRGNEVFVVTAAMLTVRSKPDRYSPRVRYLERGDRVTRLGQEGRWYKIGRNQYISSTYLRPLRNLAHH